MTLIFIHSTFWNSGGYNFNFTFNLRIGLKNKTILIIFFQQSILSQIFQSLKGVVCVSVCVCVHTRAHLLRIELRAFHMLYHWAISPAAQFFKIIVQTGVSIFHVPLPKQDCLVQRESCNDYCSHNMFP
jgi:hypothetical protein